MKKIIQNLRNQPEHIKRHILHAVTLFFGVILVTLWVYSLGTTGSPKEEVQEASALKPFSVLKDNFLNGYQSISE